MKSEREAPPRPAGTARPEALPPGSAARREGPCLTLAPGLGPPLLAVLLTLLLLAERAPAQPPQLAHPADGLVSTLPLGARLGPDQAEFRVFAPGQPALTLLLYSQAEGGVPLEVEMQPAPDGTWSGRVERDCAGLYYTLRVNGRELIDPYARAVTRYDGRGILIADRTPVAPRPRFPNQDAIIYELSVRDFTIDPDSGVDLKGKFPGLAQPGTHLTGHPEVATGLDHLSELGVNVVQIMPVAEFMHEGDAYGWGYDSVHFNAPCRWYSTSPETSVRELKQLVDALHRRGIRVVLDVVYNHTMESPERAFSFEGLCPGYYYRRRPDGSFYNGSGVGNEFRSEAPMARRFLLDSTRYWVQEVGVDGFRFDLMGLIDLETMKQVAAELRALDPDLLIYGEPWAAGETPIEVTSKGSQKALGFAVFNDHFRDALKGSVFQPSDRGFVQDGRKRDTVRIGMAGSVADFAAGPLESLNYVECHDNHTFWDRLELSTADDPTLGEADREAMDRLGAAILFTSQGIPFLQSGQEFRRSKGGEDNSYNLPDAVNMIRWQDKLAHRELYDYYRGLIALRRAHPMFRQLEPRLEFLDSPEGTLACRLTGPGDEWKEALLFFNGSRRQQLLRVEGEGWEVYVDDRRAGCAPLSTLRPGSLAVPAHSALVLGRR